MGKNPGWWNIISFGLKINQKTPRKQHVSVSFCHGSRPELGWIDGFLTGWDVCQESTPRLLQKRLGPRMVDRWIRLPYKKSKQSRKKTKTRMSVCILFVHIIYDTYVYIYMYIYIYVFMFSTSLDIPIWLHIIATQIMMMSEACGRHSLVKRDS